MKAVFYHKPDSSYDDAEGERYHFPHQYLSRVEQSLNDWIVYYGPVSKKSGRYYTGIARVASIEPDKILPKHHYARLSDYIDFDRHVEYKENGGYEKRLVKSDGSISNGFKVQAVRLLENNEFAAIINAGLSRPDDWPARFDHVQEDPAASPYETGSGLAAPAQQAILDDEFQRPIIELLSKRKWRDIKFRQNIRMAYDRTCAFTGLRLINGHGRPEVEAAHIRPVERGGNDWIRNGIALSGTVHWMFDRGMLSLSDDLSILISRHLNHDVSHLLRQSLKAKVPDDLSLRPHPVYLEWHRNNVFKG